MKKFNLVYLLMGVFLLMGATELNATVNLTIKNTGCQDLKVYKKTSGGESYQCTIYGGGTWYCTTSANCEFVCRKTNGFFLSYYLVTSSSTQTHNCDAGGCSGGTGCNDPLVYWCLDACSAGNTYNEFTPATNVPAGFASVSASIFSNIGDHSCSYGASSLAMCHAIKDGCTWGDNDNNAYRFSITISPSAGKVASFGKLTFYQKAPDSYYWVNGGSGDNDPPSKYGVRVTKNGNEVFKTIDLATKNYWSLESIDFSSDPDFTVSTQTTFNVEILGYCRQGTGGYALWDVDEIKTYGCSQLICASQGGDTDGDGVCNNNDCAPNNPALPTTPGTTCNDGNANTTNDVIQADGCTCAGTPTCNLSATFSVANGCLTNSFLIFADANDTYLPPNNPKYTYSYNIQPVNTVAGLTSVDPRSVTATFNAPGVKTVTATITNPAVPNCQIVKTTTFTVTDCSPCANAGGDTDGDGICNNVDCQPNNPAFPAAPGSSCNDGNPNTTNDVVQADGCSCAGTPSGPDCVNGINISVSGNNIVVTGLAGSPISSLQVFSGSWQTVFSCFANCGASQSITVPAGTYYVNAKYYSASYQLICEKQATVTVTGNDPCTTLGGDTDGDGVCNNNDCQPNNPAFPATVGSPCNDGNPNTTNDVVQAGGCSCAGTPVTACDNVTNGGTIGFGTGCTNSVQHCPTTGAAPAIGNCVSPSGGTGNLEVVWLKSTTSCSAPTTTAAQIAAGLDPHWTMIPGQTGLSFSPGTVTQNTCYLRCSRRAGCPVFIESNIISLTIAPNCGGGTSTPNCANIGITTQPGKIIVTGLDGAPVTSVQVFNSTWQTEFNCFGNCASPTATYIVPAGTHYVKVKYYSAAYQFICEVNQTVTVISALQGSQDESLQFGAIKHEEHTELIWSHSGGFHVSEYILERSVDGIAFEAISNKASLGGHSTELYEDYDFEPATGDNYYRLKMVDTDGTVRYSEVQLINFPVIVDYALFPNPANGFVKANLETVIGASDVSITIFNNLGLEMKRFRLDEVYSKYYQMDIRDLHEGHYIVWLNVPGKRPIAKQLMVGKL